MFVAAWGSDTFTPNIFSNYENAKHPYNPSPDGAETWRWRRFLLWVMLVRYA